MKLVNTPLCSAYMTPDRRIETPWNFHSMFTILIILPHFPDIEQNSDLLKVNNGNIWKKHVLKLTIKTPEQRHSGVFIVNYGQISHIQ